MASIVKRDKSWQAIVSMPGRRRVSKRFKKRGDAARWAAQIEARRDRGAWTVGSERVTIEQVAQVWLASGNWRDSTREGHELAVRNWVLPTFRGRRVVSLRWSEIQAWVTWMSSEGLAATTVEKNYRVMAAVLATAKADRYLDENPATIRKVQLPRKERRAEGSVRVLTSEELWSLMSALPDRMSAFAAVAAGAGLRPGEVAGLTVDCVDLDGGWISVEKQITTTKSKGRQFGPLKTPSSCRRVPIPDEIVSELRAHLEAWPALLWNGEHLVFSTRQGGPLCRSQRSSVWRDAARVAGVYRKGEGWHQLRHFYASALIAAGESVATVQARLGHSTPVETLETYVHLWPQSEAGTRGAMSAVWQTRGVG